MNKTIYLIRHGLSEGNTDRTAYSKRPDFAIRLTQKGAEQATELAQHFSGIIHPANVMFFSSPYFRALQTRDKFEEAFSGKNSIQISQESDLLREQEWSNGHVTDYNHEHEVIRNAIGSYYYRFPYGESVADCAIRARLFLMSDLLPFLTESFPNNILIFTHGMMMRALYKEALGIDIESFQQFKNPANCEFWRLDFKGRNFYPTEFAPKRKKRDHKFIYDADDIV